MVNPVTSSRTSPLERDERPKSKPAEFAGGVEGKKNRYEVKPRYEIQGIVEASDMLALPGGRFGAVSDTQDKFYIFNDEGKVKHTIDFPRLQNGSSQLEAVAYDPVKNKLSVIREEAREMLIYDFDASNPEDIESRPNRISLPPFGGDRSRTNKGVEGMAFLPGDLSITGRPQLIIANEAVPRKLFFLETNGDAKGEEVKIDGKKVRLPVEIDVEVEARKYCRDFSGVAVDPKTGDIFVSSDESHSVVQLRLKKDKDKKHTYRAEYVAHFELNKSNGDALKRIEGLAFDADGNLRLLSENNSKVYELKRYGDPVAEVDTQGLGNPPAAWVEDSP